MMTKDYWQNRYEEGTTGWDRGQASPMLQRWVESNQIPTGKVLVPGCGHGHEVLFLAERGFDVTAVDFADSAVESLRRKLRERNLNAQVVQSDVFAYQPTQPFDAIYEQTCLCAISPSQWESYERQLHQWLKVKGVLLVLFMQSHLPDGPPYHCDVGAMKELFNSMRWDWSEEDHRVEHPAGMHELAYRLNRKP